MRGHGPSFACQVNAFPIIFMGSARVVCKSGGSEKAAARLAAQTRCPAETPAMRPGECTLPTVQFQRNQRRARAKGTTPQTTINASSGPNDIRPAPSSMTPRMALISGVNGKIFRAG